MLPFRQPFYTTGLSFVAAFPIANSSTSATLASYGVRSGDFVIFVGVSGQGASIASGALVSRGSDGGLEYFDRRVVTADLPVGVTTAASGGVALVYRGGAGSVAIQTVVASPSSNPVGIAGYIKASNHLATIAVIYHAPGSLMTAPAAFVTRIDANDMIAADRLTPPNALYNDGDAFSATLSSLSGGQKVTILELRSL